MLRNMDPLEPEVKKTFIQVETGLSGRRGGMKEAAMEMRPGGMLVQKREPELKQRPVHSSPCINVTVKYGSTRKEIRINSQANFGELKKLVAEYTGVHHLDQKLIFKKEERHSREFLDESGVKNGSKIVLVEDSSSRDTRCLQMVKLAKIEKAKKHLQRIASELEVMQHKVRAMESSASRGEVVKEAEMDDTIDALMKNLVALNGIFVSGTLKLEKNSQECRAKKLVEALDVLKLDVARRIDTARPRNLMKLDLERKAGLVSHCNLMDEMPITNGKHQAAQLKPSSGKDKFPFLKHHQQNLVDLEPITTKWVTFE